MGSLSSDRPLGSGGLTRLLRSGTQPVLDGANPDRTVPFGAEHALPYMLGFLLLLVSVGMGWITAGAMLGGVASSRGWGALVPRVGAAAVGTFAVLLLMAPLLG